VKHCPNLAREVRASRLAPGLGETAMGEALVLLSCGAAFITGIVIAAASLFGRWWPRASLPPVHPEDRGRFSAGARRISWPPRWNAGMGLQLNRHGHI
jgi:hypothetical protein